MTRCLSQSPTQVGSVQSLQALNVQWTGVQEPSQLGIDGQCVRLICETEARCVLVPHEETIY